MTEDELQDKAVELCQELWSLGVRTEDGTKWDYINQVAPLLCDALRGCNTQGYEEGHADGIKGGKVK